MIKNYNDEEIPSSKKLLENLKEYDEELLCKKKLLSVKEALKEIEEGVSGLYIIYDDKSPVYVGISRNIKRRFRQHFKTLNHNTSSFLYRLAKENYKKVNNKEYTGNREKFEIKEYGKIIQDELNRNYRIKYIQVSDFYFLALLEIYASCLLETKWNSFKTH